MQKGDKLYLYRRIFTGCQILATGPAEHCYLGVRVQYPSGRLSECDKDLWGYVLQTRDGIHNELLRNLYLIGIFTVK